MNPSLNEVIAKGSNSFKRLNATAPVQVPLGKGGKAGKNLPLVAPLPGPEPESDGREALDRFQRAKDQGETGPADRPVVHISLHRVALFDADNKWSAVKYLLDGLRKAELIPDDRERDIQLIVDQTKVNKYNLEGTGIVITYPVNHHEKHD